uniref:LITAF domain-containing protein n=1 Tax=Bombyx mori TaxID=7091 RepID=A0A8R1WI49_BOMMO|nr:lipopolysaccharide-induced tumor necrosis factor-alpha factor [Bombyx mori]
MENHGKGGPLATTVYQVPAIEKPLLGPGNTDTICPFCRASIRSAIKYSITSKTHIAAALWCLVCCLCCMPYASDTCKNVDHFCPNCHKYIGTYAR